MLKTSGRASFLIILFQFTFSIAPSPLFHNILLPVVRCPCWNRYQVFTSRQAVIRDKRSRDIESRLYVFHCYADILMLLIFVVILSLWSPLCFFCSCCCDASIVVIYNSCPLCFLFSFCLSHCRLKKLPYTIYWKILISILGMSAYVI